MSFNYKDLSGSIHIGLLNYTRELQQHAIDLEAENEELKERLAVSGSRALQDRAEKWSEQWQDKCIENGELKRQLIEQAAEKDAEISRLQYQVDYLQQQLEQYQRAENPVKTPVNRGRDPKTGRFDTSIPASDKPYKAWLMSQQGYSPTQIAVKLGVSRDTVKRYIRSENAKRGEESGSDLEDDAKPGVYLA